jgi:glyoxylase-like metal-dependent hydrolase (beta-lactamase superfamily II)
MMMLLTSVVLHASPVAVHGYTAPEAQFAVNTWFVETPKGVVVIDTQFTVSTARAARKKLQALGKPVLAVLLTHAHPDHVNGTAELLEGAEVPVVALESVKKVLEAIDGPKRAYWSPILKEEYPAKTVFPTRVLRDGESITFDGVAFRGFDLGQSESDAEAVWISGGNAFVGDLVMNRVHPWLAEGHSAAWLAALKKAEALEGIERVYPGHGAAGGRELFAWQKSYLEAYRKAVREVASGRASLSDAEKQALEARMEKVLPHAPLKMLVSMSADSVAAELAAK